MCPSATIIEKSLANTAASRYAPSAQYQRSSLARCPAASSHRSTSSSWVPMPSSVAALGRIEQDPPRDVGLRARERHEVPVEQPDGREVAVDHVRQAAVAPGQRGDVRRVGAQPLLALLRERQGFVRRRPSQRPRPVVETVSDAAVGRAGSQEQERLDVEAVQPGHCTRPCAPRGRAAAPARRRRRSLRSPTTAGRWGRRRRSSPSRRTGRPRRPDRLRARAHRASGPGNAIIASYIR